MLGLDCMAFALSLSVGLQGEHGTGRNVAPFVEMEWGSKAYELMWELKHLFDPTFVLNPGVVLNKVPCTLYLASHLMVRQLGWTNGQWV